MLFLWLLSWEGKNYTTGTQRSLLIIYALFVCSFFLWFYWPTHQSLTKMVWDKQKRKSVNNCNDVNNISAITYSWTNSHNLLGIYFTCTTTIKLHCLKFNMLSWNENTWNFIYSNTNAWVNFYNFYSKCL